jgi:hypothetical protein
MRRRYFTDSQPNGQARVHEPAGDYARHGVEEALRAAQARADQVLLFRQRSKEVFQNGR